jgi:hypothetical protein
MDYNEKLQWFIQTTRDNIGKVVTSSYTITRLKTSMATAGKQALGRSSEPEEENPVRKKPQ